MTESCIVNALTTQTYMHFFFLFWEETGGAGKHAYIASPFYKKNKNKNKNEHIVSPRDKLTHILPRLNNVLAFEKTTTNNYILIKIQVFIIYNIINI